LQNAAVCALVAIVQTLGIDHGNICTAALVLCQCISEVNCGYQIAVCQNDILCLGVFYETPDIAQCFQTTLIGTAADLTERRQQVQTALFPSQIPFTAGTQMIQQGAVVGLGDNADFGDAGVYHIGKRKVYHAVTSAVRDRTHCPQLGQIDHCGVIDTCKN